MVDHKELKKRGIWSGAYKPLFTSNDPPPLIKKLVGVVRDRIRVGREANLTNYKTYWAIDLAHEAAFRQTTPTLIQSLMARNLKPTQLLEELKGIGLSEEELFLNVTDDKGHTVQMLNPPTFYKILIPIVAAYHATRTAKLYNERDKSPLFKYVPSKQTDGNRVKCEIITDIVDDTAQWYGWTEYLKTAIQQMLKYGVVLAFPKEEWHCEKQVIDGTVVVQKEGLRYDIPHVTRMGWDLHHPLPTINSDTGVEFAYHWTVPRYGDILDNRMYWNKTRITHGSNWMEQPLYRNYFSEVYPCQMKFPIVDNGTMKREDKAAYYGTNERDNSIFLTEFFWKLVPSQWGLGDYKYPVWHRFTVASDSTILWAAPCAYNPVWMMGYNFDASSSQPSSFSLECIPWQDHMGMILSQMVLTARQNLVNLVFYDKNMVDPATIKKLENLGERLFRTLNFLQFDSLKFSRSGINQKEAFHRVDFPFRSIVELQSMMGTELNIMERVLGITAQETGAAASHYQSKTEVDQTASSSDNRLNYTASGVDSGIDAWKRQAYEANMAYRDDEVEAKVTAEIKDVEKHLEEIGFKIEQRGDRVHLVGGSKAKLSYVEFARENVGPSDNLDPQMGAIIFQTLGVISQKPEFVQAIGIKRIVKLLEQGSKLAGAPADFDLTTPQDDAGGAGTEQFMAQLKPILAQLQQSIMQTVTEKVTQPIAQEVASQQQTINEIGTAVTKLESIFKQVEQIANKANIKTQEIQQQMQIDAAKFQAEEQRKQQAHEAELKRKAESAAVDAQLEQTTAGIAAATAQATAQIDVEVQKQLAESKIATDRKLARSKIRVAEENGDAKIALSRKIARQKPKASKQP